MNMHGIEYFFALAESLNFTVAAEKCFITQAAMSRYITGLEKELGVKLFYRNSHSVQLTECGKLYLHEMKNITRSYENLRKQLKSLENDYSGSLKIGIGLYEYQFVEKSIIEFIHTYPQIKIELYRNSYGEIVQWLKNGSLDVLFAADYCSQSFYKNELLVQTLYKGKIVIVMNKDLAQKYANGSVKDLLIKEKIITNAETEGPYSFEEIKDFFIQTLGIVPPSIVQTNSQKLQFLMAQMGYGVLLVPEFLDEIKQYDLVCMDVFDSSEEVYQLMRLAKNNNPVIDLFMDYIAVEEK